MTENNNRIPLLIAVIGVAVLLTIGGYVFWPSSTESDQTTYTAKSASVQAEKALSVAGMNADDRAATEAVVRAYILENPEIITEAITILQQRDTAARLAQSKSAMTKPFYKAEAGNPNGDVTVVQFTDYNCGYCRTSVPDVEQLIAQDKGVRVVYREVPILSATSRDAALWALAAAKQGKHAGFHKAMFAGDRPDARTIRAAAARAGVDIDAAMQFVASAEANKEVDNNLAIMQQVGFSGTPTFIIGDQILEGALGYGALKAAVSKARRQG